MFGGIMIDSYGGNLVYHGGNFVGGVEKKDYIEPNVVLRTDFGYFYSPPASASPVFSCTDVPTGTTAIGTSAIYSTAWHSWGAPTVNDCYVYSAAWSGKIYYDYMEKGSLTAKQDINKVWKGTDRPVPTYVVKEWSENGYHYGFYPVNALEGLGLISICYDRSHSASQIKPSGYQLDCSHIKNYAVLKADLGPSSYACFNVLGKSNGSNSGCYWIENLTALDCSALVGGPVVSNNSRGLYPYVIKNALFSIASGVDYSFQKLGCKYAINVSGASDDIERNTLYAENLSGCHNVMLDGLYVTTSKSDRFINEGWWKRSNDNIHKEWQFTERGSSDYVYDTDGTRISGGIIDSDVKINRNYYYYSEAGGKLSYVERSTVDLTDGDYWRTSNAVFKDSTFSGMLTDMILPTNSGMLPRSPFSSCTFNNVMWYQKKNGISAIFNLASAYTNTSGYLLGVWTSASF